MFGNPLNRDIKQVLNNQTVESYYYDAFGEASVFDAAGQELSHSAFNNRFLFTGREWIKEIGLYDYRNRVYSPSLGRFLQTDPILFEAEDINIYRYCWNDPINWIDPEGLAGGGKGSGKMPSAPMQPGLPMPAGAYKPPRGLNNKNWYPREDNDPCAGYYKQSNRDRKEDKKGQEHPKKKGKENKPPPPSDPTGKRETDRENFHKEKEQEGRDPHDNYGSEGRKPEGT